MFLVSAIAFLCNGLSVLIVIDVGGSGMKLLFFHFVLSTHIQFVYILSRLNVLYDFTNTVVAG